jgi:hypothetical protein
MVLITIVNGVYKPTYNWGAPPCREFYQTTFLGYQAGTNTQYPWELLSKRWEFPHHQLRSNVAGKIKSLQPW